MFGISPFAPHGPGGIARPISLPDIPQIAERRVDHIEKRLEAGKLDTETLDKRLHARFGDRADGIVGEDGKVDFGRLEKLFAEARSGKLQDRLHARFGDAADGIVGPDGNIDKERLGELFAEKRIDNILTRLEKKFGAAFEGIVGENGKIDFDALKALLEGTRPPEKVPPSDPPAIDPPVGDVRGIAAAGVAAPIDKIEAEDLRPAAGDEIPDARPAETDEGGGRRVSAVEQLSELRKILFHERLENRFGDAADRVFTDDGEIDFTALRELLGERQRSRLDRPDLGRPRFHEAPVRLPPLFDIRA